MTKYNTLCIYIDRKMVVRLCGLRVISLICLFFQGSTVAREASDKEKVPSPVTCQHHSWSFPLTSICIVFKLKYRIRRIALILMCSCNTNYHKNNKFSCNIYIIDQRVFPVVSITNMIQTVSGSLSSPECPHEHNIIASFCGPLVSMTVHRHFIFF